MFCSLHKIFMVSILSGFCGFCAPSVTFLVATTNGAWNAPDDLVLVMITVQAFMHGQTSALYGMLSGCASECTIMLNLAGMSA